MEKPALCSSGSRTIAIMNDFTGALSEQTYDRTTGVIVLAITITLFLIFGYNEEYLWTVKMKSPSELIWLAFRNGIIPIAIVSASIYLLTVYVRSRPLRWAIYGFVVFAVVAYAYPNFHNLIFFVNN